MLSRQMAGIQSIEAGALENCLIYWIQGGILFNLAVSDFNYIGGLYSYNF